MNNIIKELLDLLNVNGNTYLVGGAVINYLNHTKTSDLDLATTLSDSDLKRIFPDIVYRDFGGYKLEYKGYHIDITHLRKDITILNGYPHEYIFTDALKEDALRRDFTINAIYLNQDLEIIDYVKGMEDFNNKIINVIGDINIIKNDPIRILRAIRFMITYNFKLSKALEEFIKTNQEIIDYTNKHIINEIKKIKALDNYQNYVNYINDLGLDLSLI